MEIGCCLYCWLWVCDWILFLVVSFCMLEIIWIKCVWVWRFWLNLSFDIKVWGFSNCWVLMWCLGDFYWCLCMWICKLCDFVVWCLWEMFFKSIVFYSFFRCSWRCELNSSTSCRTRSFRCNFWWWCICCLVFYCFWFDVWWVIEILCNLKLVVCVWVCCLCRESRSRRIFRRRVATFVLVLCCLFFWIFFDMFWWVLWVIFWCLKCFLLLNCLCFCFCFFRREIRIESD